MVVGTAVVGGLLTLATATLSDEAAAGAIAAEVATATEIAATAAQQVVAVLATLGSEAAGLAGRWAVLTAVTTGADAVSGMVVHRDGDVLGHIHWGEDAELALVGALGVPIGSAALARLSAVSPAAHSPEVPPASPPASPSGAPRWPPPMRPGARGAA